MANFPQDVFQSRPGSPAAPYLNMGRIDSEFQYAIGPIAISYTATATASPLKKTVGCYADIQPAGSGGIISIDLSLNYSLMQKPIVSVPVILSNVPTGGLQVSFNPNRPVSLFLNSGSDVANDLTVTSYNSNNWIWAQYDLIHTVEHVEVLCQTYEPTFEFDKVDFTAMVIGDQGTLGPAFEIHLGVGVISI